MNPIADWLLNRAADVFDVATTVVDNTAPWILLTPAAATVTWLTYRQLRNAAAWLTREIPADPDWGDGFDPADIDELAITSADIEVLEAVGPPAIDLHPAPADDVSRALDAAYYADAINARKETER